MSGFSAEWLALREPADHSARDAGLRDHVVRRLSGCARPMIVDLGCGTGSNLRALAPHLGPDQRWRLVDYDPALLAAARAALIAWADRATDGEQLLLEKHGRRIEVGFTAVDLVADLPSALAGPVDLVTAAAFFDLVSADWIGRFAQELAARRLPLYTVLTYTGEEAWSPPHSLDERVHAAFLAHQGSDKGFGPAAGPAAPQALRHAFAAQGYGVTTAASDWRLGPESAALLKALAEGIAAAAREAEPMAAADVADWLAARLQAASCRVGHEDFFAKPKPSP